MKTSQILSLGLLALICSGCDLYGYQAPLCTPEHATNASSLAGNYTYSSFMTVNGKALPFGRPADTSISEDSSGNLTLNLMPSQKLVHCEINGKELLETRQLQDGSPGVGAFLVSRTSQGFDLNLIAFDLDAVKAKMDVSVTTQHPSDGPMGMPIDTSEYLADNRAFPAADFAAFLKPNPELIVHFLKK